MHEPYRINENEDLTAAFRRYLDDPKQSININGVTFYHALYVVRTSIKGISFIAALDNRMCLKINDKVSDEMGNIFTVGGFEMFRFAGGIPEWFMHISHVCLLGNCEYPGEYFAKIVQNSDKENA